MLFKKPMSLTMIAAFAGVFILLLYPTFFFISGPLLALTIDLPLPLGALLIALIVMAIAALAAQLTLSIVLRLGKSKP